MATVNLGAIKFNWKGAFNNSTAYAVDDVVSSGGSSYVCILASQGNAVSNGTYWNQMSAAGTNGTNGTNVATTITTQGDILYRDGSGLQRLGAGTSGQVLQTGGTGANPSWTTVAGGAFSQLQYRQVGGNQLSNSNQSNYVSGLTHHYVEITPSTNASDKRILVNLNPRIVWNRSNGDCGFEYQLTRTVGGSTTIVQTSSSIMAYVNTGSGTNIRLPLSIWYMDTPQTTSAVKYSFNFRNPHSTSPVEVGSSEANTYNTYLAYELN